MATTSFQKPRSILSLTLTALAIAVSFLLQLGVNPASAQTIVDEWATVQAPKPPALKPVTLDHKTTALLVLDFVKQTCNAERRPRCLTSVPKVQALLKLARDKGLKVVHSITTAATPADIAKELTPAEGEPIVKAPADKFFKTDLERILNDKGVKTVVIVGTAAQGAVLNTASQAAFRRLQVIIPVDGMSAENTYFEQYTVIHLANAPGVGQQVTLTKIDMIK
jgi:nicotinamidase-related amidase